MAFDPNFGKYISSIYSIKLQTGRWFVQSFGPINIIFNEMNNDNMLPSLVTIPDFNKTSYQNTTDIITNMDHYLAKKYHKIYIIDWCGVDNTLKERYDDIKMDEDMTNFGLILAKYLDLIFVNKYKLTNIHLLATSYGSMVATYMLQLNTIYSGLFLSSPSIPSNVYSFNNIGYKLKNVKLRFSWNIDSPTMDDKTIYDAINSISHNKLNYKSRYYSPEFMNTIHPDFILDIIN